MSTRTSRDSTGGNPSSAGNSRIGATRFPRRSTTIAISKRPRPGLYAHREVERDAREDGESQPMVVEKGAEALHAIASLDQRPVEHRAAQRDDQPGVVERTHPQTDS